MKKKTNVKAGGVEPSPFRVVEEEEVIIIAQPVLIGPGIGQ